MFELSILRKYLIPRKKNLSMTLIALMSVGVISLVVWLIILFLSVTEGIEKTWLEKLTTLNSPLRITPTQNYYSSYYHLIDTISHKSRYAPLSLREKLSSPSDPYDPETDETIPSYWPKPDLNAEGEIKDPVKIAAAILSELDVTFQDFEMGGAMLKLQLNRGGSHSFLTQASYLASFPEKNPFIKNLLMQPIQNITEGGIYISKQFLENGVQVGDKGWLSYPAATAGALQEQRLPIVVAGFYDPGVVSIGNKCILAPFDIVHHINKTSQMEHFDKSAGAGFAIWFKEIKNAPKIGEEISRRFHEAGIAGYWKVTTYKQYDFAKDLLQQFQSDRYLFTLIGLIILLVACCNIISLLVILVNDKKKEIGILQALGAPTRSIALIFGSLGAFIGILSSLIGVSAALLTLKNLDTLVKFLSFLQGQEAFSAAFYGSSLPHSLSSEALLFVLCAGPILSLIAGLIPAWKACRLSPSQILRSE